MSIDRSEEWEYPRIIALVELDNQHVAPHSIN
jgi:hypothetical protein